MTDIFKVAAAGLNLRSAAVVDPANRIAVLPQGQTVKKIAEAADPAWWEVSTQLQGSSVQGFVSHRFLTPVATVDQTNSPVVAAHLHPTSPIMRSSASGRAYPLNEPGQPIRSGANPVSDLTAIISYLDVESEARYRPIPNGSTFCNIYAYDYGYLAGVYLPRVWWKASAIVRLKAGDSVPVLYDNTVDEINANSLYSWFVEWGPTFGWRRVTSLTELQNAANDGGVGVISGQNVHLNMSGHITVVVPESGGHTAVRSGSAVTQPLQSQAGRHNHAYHTQVWWTAAEFGRFAFWIHD